MAASKKKNVNKGKKKKYNAPKKSLTPRQALPLFDTLTKTGGKQRSILLGHLNDESCQALYQAVHNVLVNPNVTSKQKKRLQTVLLPHAKQVRYLADYKKSEKAKRKKLLQLGGFPLATILSVAIPLLMRILRK